MTDTDTQQCYPIAVFNQSHLDINRLESVDIPANWFGVIKIMFDGHYWNLIQL